MRKKLLILQIIINCMFLTSCFNYTDINKALFVTTIVVDIDKDNNPLLYVEAFKPVKGSAGGEGQESGDGKRIIFKGTGKTVLEAVKDINLSSSFKVNYTQNKAVIYTRKAATYGLDNFADIFDRGQEFIIRPDICILDGDPIKFITSKYEEDKFIGMFINELLKNVGTSSRAVELPLNNYYSQRIIGDRTNVITMIDLKKNTFGNKIEVSGGAVIYEDKLVDIIERNEGQGYNFLMDTVDSGTLEITNPEEENKFVTLEILHSKTKTDIEYKDDNIVLKKNIKVVTTIAEAQKKFFLNKKSIYALERTAEKNIEKYTNQLFEEYKHKHMDIFDITEQVYRKYPNVPSHNIIDKTELKVNAEVEIQSSGDTIDWRPSNK